MGLHWGAMWTRCPLDSSRPIVMLSGPRDLWVRLGYPHSARHRKDAVTSFRCSVSCVKFIVEKGSLLKKSRCWRKFIVDEISLMVFMKLLLSCTTYNDICQLDIFKISILFYHLLANIYTGCLKSTGTSRYLCSHSNKYVNKIAKAKFRNHFRCK